MKNLFEFIEKIIGGSAGPTVTFGLERNENDLPTLKKVSKVGVTCILKPLKGLEWNGQLIPFGASKKEVEMVMGNPAIVNKSYYYFENELRFDFDKKGNIEFIEFLGGIDGKLKPIIYDMSAFESSTDELKKLLREKNAGEVDDAEGEYSSSFLNISVGVYRDITPGDVQEMIEDMKADGIPTEGNEDLENDKRRANHWGTIGIGIAGYYKK